MVFLLPILFSSMVVDSTEIDFSISNVENYQLNYKITENHFVTVPSNPNVLKTVNTYADAELTVRNNQIEPNTSFMIDAARINNQNQLVFHVKEKGYLAADATILYDDQILNKQEVHQTVWLKKDPIFYSSPIGNQQKKVETSLRPYQSVLISEKVKTHIGDFVKVEGVGYLSQDAISEEDNRIEAVQELLDKKYTSSNYGIYVKQLSTNQEAGVNQNKKMYSASIAKLPLLYYTQKEIDEGTIALSKTLQYIDKTLTFKGSYNTEGSGSLPKQADNKDYSLEDLINRVSKESDNAASNLLAYYVAHQFKEDYYDEITAITGERWDMSSREASPKTAGRIMEAIYQQNGYVLRSLQGTHFDQERIPRDIPVPVAHKIGDAYDFRHDVGLVFTQDPFVLAIFTENSDYDSISQIAYEIYGILK